MDQVRFEQNFRRIVMKLNALNRDAQAAQRPQPASIPSESRADQSPPRRRRRDR